MISGKVPAERCEMIKNFGVGRYSHPTLVFPLFLSLSLLSPFSEFHSARFTQLFPFNVHLSNHQPLPYRHRATVIAAPTLPTDVTATYPPYPYPDPPQTSNTALVTANSSLAVSEITASRIMPG